MTIDHRFSNKTLLALSFNRYGDIRIVSREALAAGFMNSPAASALPLTNYGTEPSEEERSLRSCRVVRSLNSLVWSSVIQFSVNRLHYQCPVVRNSAPGNSGFPVGRDIFVV